MGANKFEVIFVHNFLRIISMANISFSISIYSNDVCA